MLFFDLLKSKKDKEKILDKFLDIRVLPAPTDSDGYSTERWIETGFLSQKSTACYRIPMAIPQKGGLKRPKH